MFQVLPVKSLEVAIPTDKSLNRRNKTNLFGSLKRIQVRTLSQRLETNIGSSGLPVQSWEWEAAEGARARGEALRKQGPVKNLRGIGGDREEVLPPGAPQHRRRKIRPCFHQGKRNHFEKLWSFPFFLKRPDSGKTN